MMVDSGRKSLKLCMCGVTDAQRKATVGAHLGRHVLAGRTCTSPTTTMR
jgi:hypothetical protein